jgi:hypothetical protein
MGRQGMAAADSLIQPIVAPFETPIRAILGLFQRAFNAITGAHNKVATLHNTTIPKAQADAVASANEYTNASIATLQGDAVAAQAKLVTDQDAAIAAAKLESASGTTMAFTLFHDALMARIAEDTTTYNAIESEIATELPLEVGNAAQAAAATEDQALSAQATTSQTTLDALNNKLTNAENGVTVARTNIAAAEEQLAVLLPSPAASQTEITALQRTITTSTDDINQLIQTIDDLESQITGVSDTLGRVHTTQALRTINHTPTEIGAVVGLATVVGLMAKTLWSLKTKVDTCMVDNCDTTNPNNIHNILKDILASITAASEIGYVTSAIADPVGFANAQAPVMEGVDASAVSLLNSILGI